jgi:drug/metabolite transporter superfamily protein YnfA
MDFGIPAYEYVTTLLAALAAPMAGVQIVRWILPQERRLLVVLGIGGSLGIGLVTFALTGLAALLPLYLVIGAIQLTTIALAIRAVDGIRRGQFRLEFESWAFRAAVAFMFLALFVAAVGYVSSVWYGNSHENLLIQLALSSHLAAGNWPPVNPWEPDYVQTYRFGGQLWTAAVSLTAQADIFVSGLAVTLVATAFLLLGVYAFISLLVNRAAGLLAAIFVTVAAPQNFLSLLLANYPDYSPSVAYTLAEHLNRFKQGYVLGTAFEQLAAFNFTVLVGIAGALGAAGLSVLLARERTIRPVAILAAAAAFGGASITTEHLFPVLAGTIGIVALVLLVRKRLSAAAGLAAVVALGTLAGVLATGPLNAAIFGDAEATSSYIQWYPGDLFTLPTREILSPGSTSIFFQTESIGRAELLGALMWKQFGWLLVGIGGCLAIAIWKRRPEIAVPALAAFIMLMIPGVLRDVLNPHNTGRFVVAALVMAAMSLGIVVDRLWRQSGQLKAVGRVVASGLAVLVGGTWLLTLPLLPMEFQAYESPVLADELEAARFAAALPYPQRALLLPGPRTFAELNSSLGDGMHKYAVTFGRLRVPMGFDNLGHRDDYEEPYAEAQDTLALERLQELRIDLIYVAVDQISTDQGRLLEAAVEGGYLREAFTSTGDARRIYEVVTGVPDVPS